MNTELQSEINPEAITPDQQSELESRSIPFVGQWDQLISTTNWEKGAIICRWREEMEQADMPKSCYSDQRWSDLVGTASAPHVGRLRKTWQRFGHVHEEYEGLYWSHFYAAIDWDDAEMWLEGAIQNSWTVSAMREKRWETLDKRPEDQPQVDQIVVSEEREETHSLQDKPPTTTADREFIEGPVHEGPDFGDADQPCESGLAEQQLSSDTNGASAERVKPFESLADLPGDIREAANGLKIAIIRHKADEWQEISLDSLLQLLDGLKSLASAPSG